MRALFVQKIYNCLSLLVLAMSLDFYAEANATNSCDKLFWPTAPRTRSNSNVPAPPDKENGFFNKLKNSASKLLKSDKVKRTEDVTILGDVSPDRFFQNVLPSFFRNARKGDAIFLYDFKTRFSNDKARALKSGKWIRDLESGNVVTQNGELENHLLFWSKVYGGAEVLEIRVLDRNGKELSNSGSPVIGSQKVLSDSDISYAFMGLLIPSTSAIIEINHTHPAYEFLVYKNGNQNDPNNPPGSISPLSIDDLQVAQDISALYPNFYVRIRATVPNGYTYQITFKAGTVVEDPVLK